jgi:aminobenzoyl-glutamate transport protein
MIKRVLTPGRLRTALLGLAALAAVSAMVALLTGLSAVDPISGHLITVDILSAKTLAHLLTQAPATVTAFPPLGIFLLLALGTAVADRSGLFAALVRGSLSIMPAALLTPVVILTGYLFHQISDALLLVYLPLSGAVFAARGRDPVLGILIAFAAFSGGFAASLGPGIPDIILLQLTEDAARSVAPDWRYALFGNWFILLAVAGLYAGATWAIAERWLEPRWFPRTPSTAEARPEAIELQASLKPAERMAMIWAGLAALAAALVFIAVIRWGASAPDGGHDLRAVLTPYFRAMPACLTLILLSAGWSYGAVTGTLTSPMAVHAAVVDGLARLAPFILFAILIALFLSVLHASRLDTVLMLSGARTLADAQLAPPLILMTIVLVTAVLDLLVGSATAKWAILAPIIVPMLMLLGISPDMSTAAFRIGDGALNIVSPLQPWIYLVVLYCRRWRPGFSLADALRNLAPFSAAYLVLGLMVVGIWSLAEWPVGPFSSFHYDPGAAVSLSR